METKETFLQMCYHCGNEGLLYVESKFIDKYNDYEKNTPIYWYEDQYSLLKCPVCGNVTCIKRSTDEGMRSFQGKQEYDLFVLYPNVSCEYKDVPDEIKSSFEAAKKVEKIDSSICALSLRRVLELICIDKQALGDNLEKKIKDLVNKNILPSTFDAACKHIRIIGNEGAHENQLSIPSRELKTLIEYLESIINYLYVLPEKIKRLTNIKTVKA